jgi:hypothetical protein
VNITDIEAEAPTEGDWLKNICRRQFELEQKYEDIEKANGFFVPLMPLDVDDAKSQWFIKDAVYRLVEELSEATNTLKNKPWKVTQVPTDQTHFLEELADAIHFMVRVFIYLTGDPDKAAEMIYRLYFKKSEVNKFRQATKY